MASEPEREFYRGRVYLACSNRHIRLVATGPAIENYQFLKMSTDFTLATCIQRFRLSILLSNKVTLDFDREWLASHPLTREF